MSQCNYCRLAGIRERAKRNRQHVTTVRLASIKRDFPGNVEVFVHPRSVNPADAEKTLDSGGDRLYFAAWFAKLPDECRC